ncbi:sigma factor G inhibitor Gin [Tissierella sp. MB52-C2]|uniref:sigma factor G inhibitor Gin n=1 Tax=Tissierella sp. MB52-C2 TaxID=3070999 RepID=UPI00280AE0BF|nr:sigma factor G inhibitor Gin [Tissierella sp. MB52-C2]WMM24409.1 sigma factor G inhibitor Gin [Tissierella sp. MB52-C2]
MYCIICGNEKTGITLLRQTVCKDCIDEIVNVSIFDENYDLYKNFIRILLGYYISEKHQLNPVN